MFGIDTRVVRHLLFINTTLKPVARRKQKVGEEEHAPIDEEMGKLNESGFVRRLATFSRFCSCAGNRSFHFFSTSKKKRFDWTSQCEKAFVELKPFLAPPIILTRLEDSVEI